MKMKDSLGERARFTELDNEDISKDKEMTLKMLSQSVRNNYFYRMYDNLSNVEDIVSFTWGVNINNYLHAQASEQTFQAVVNSVWSLSEQAEYLMFRLLHNKSFVPKVLGTCGPAYFVEYTQTLKTFENSFSVLKSIPWHERAKVAINLLELIHTLDTNLHQTLHFCDMKANNFGLRKNGEITAIDTDCALFHQDLLMQFNHSNCTQHSDCDFFDCLGWCDKDKGVCAVYRSNNNLQVKILKIS